MSKKDTFTEVVVSQNRNMQSEVKMKSKKNITQQRMRELANEQSNFSMAKLQTTNSNRRYDNSQTVLPNIDVDLPKYVKKTERNKNRQMVANSS